MFFLRLPGKTYDELLLLDKNLSNHEKITFGLFHTNGHVHQLTKPTKAAFIVGICCIIYLQENVNL